VFGTSSVLGPVVGGLLAGQGQILGITGWRWVFFVNLPIGLVALVVVSKVLNIDHIRRDHRIDWEGALALVIALVPLLIVAEQGRSWGWTSTRSVMCIAVGLVGVVLFVLAERRAREEALLPLRMFGNRTFGIGTLLNFVIGMGMFGGLAALPLYLQLVKGATPTEAGLQLLPLTFGIMTASVVSGQAIARTGRYKIYPVIGSGLLVVGALLLSRLGADTPYWQTAAFMAIFGFGLGLNMQPLVLAIQNAVSPRDMGVATSSATFFRQMGGTVGTAVFLSILFSSAADKIAGAFQKIAPTAEFQSALRDPAVLANPANAPVVDTINAARGGGSASLPSGVLDDSSFLLHMDPRLARPFLVGFAESIDLVLLVGAAVLAIAFLLTWFLPEVPLRTSSGMAAARAEAAAEAEKAAAAAKS
jgi:MFS family permease